VVRLVLVKRELSKRFDDEPHWFLMVRDVV